MHCKSVDNVWNIAKSMNCPDAAQWGGQRDVGWTLFPILCRQLYTTGWQSPMDNCGLSSSVNESLFLFGFHVLHHHRTRLLLFYLVSNIVLQWGNHRWLLRCHNCFIMFIVLPYALELAVCNSSRNVHKEIYVSLGVASGWDALKCPMGIHAKDHYPREHRGLSQWNKYARGQY
jgi:hypothetical protein